MRDRGPGRGRPKLSVLLATLVAGCVAAAAFAIDGQAGLGGACLDRGPVPCAPITPWVYVAVAALPGLIAAYVFARPPGWPAAGVTWCLPLLAVLAGVRALRLALEPAEGIAWAWLVLAPVLVLVGVGLVVRWARTAGEREAPRPLAVLLLVLCVPIGFVLGAAFTAIVT